MRRTRFMSLFFLVLSVAFLMVQDFRWALELPIVLSISESRRIHYLTAIPAGELQAYRASAEQRGDGEALAFTAMHIDADRETVFRLAEQAVARDPKLTWVLWHIYDRYRRDLKEPAVAKRYEEWARKLQAADPENALPYLMEGEMLRERDPQWPKGTMVKVPGSTYLAAVAAKTEWCAAMEHAFRGKRYDSYLLSRFYLDRRVMAAQSWATPPIMVLNLAGYPIPSLLNIREYANVEVNVRAADAIAAKHEDEAVRRYWKTLAFGQMMHVQGLTLIEKLIGFSVELIASEPLQAAMAKKGNLEEAQLLQLHIADLKHGDAVAPRNDPFARSSIHYWAGMLFFILAFQTYVFAGLTLLAILYVNAKLWIRPQIKGRIYQVVTVAENYLPVLLFMSCLALFLVYAPYAGNFRHYLTATGDTQSLEAMFTNVFPAPWFLPSFLYLPIPNPFRAYLPWAVAGFLLVVAYAAWEEWRVRQKRATP